MVWLGRLECRSIECFLRVISASGAAAGRAILRLDFETRLDLFMSSNLLRLSVYGGCLCTHLLRWELWISLHSIPAITTTFCSIHRSWKLGTFIFSETQVQVKCVVYSAKFLVQCGRHALKVT